MSSKTKRVKRYEGAKSLVGDAVTGAAKTAKTLEKWAEHRARVIQEGTAAPERPFGGGGGFAAAAVIGIGALNWSYLFWL